MPTAWPILSRSRNKRRLSTEAFSSYNQLGVGGASLKPPGNGTGQHIGARIELPTTTGMQRGARRSLSKTEDSVKETEFQSKETESWRYSKLS